MLLRITPHDKRLKQLVREFGELWRFKRFTPNPQFNPGIPHYYVVSLCGTHERWIAVSETTEVLDVSEDN